LKEVRERLAVRKGALKILICRDSFSRSYTRLKVKNNIRLKSESAHSFGKLRC
jgi:hypothetical protein